MTTSPLNVGVWCVCGSRATTDQDYVFRALCLHAAAFGMPRVIVHGGARGVDSLASAWCYASGVAQQVWRADWHTHGHAAGPIRTRAMLTAARPELLLAFPGGAGTRFAMKTAAALGIRVDAVS